MAESTFKKIAFENLSESQKAQMEANAASFTQIVRDEAGRPVINERTGRAETYTPTAEEYYNIRGGVNRAGYFGDAYIPAETSGRPYLTEEEYFTALEGKTGVARGGAINIATAKKAYDLAISQGKTREQAIAASGYDPETGGIVGYPSGTPFGTGTTGGGVGGGVGGTSATGLATQQAAQAAAEEKRRAGQSAWNVLKGYLDNFGLGVLAGDIERYIKDGLSYEELLLKLRTESNAYKRRFSANAGRIAKGLRALSEAEYIALEDQYQNVMRRYGMPDTYYAQTTDPTTGIKIQQGFEKFIEGDVSPVELEDRIQTAYTRVINAAPEVMGTLRQFYGDLITNGDILAYALDTKNAIENIKRKVGAAEIGAEATQAGLATTMARAEELQKYGITQARAEQGFQAIADILPSATRLSEIYRRQGLGEYTQETAEQEAFGIPGAAEAGRKRRKLTELEQAQFAGRSGAAGGALARDRAGSI